MIFTSKKKSTRLKEKYYVHKMSCLDEELREKIKVLETTLETEEYQKEVHTLYEKDFKERVEEIKKQMNR